MNDAAKPCSPASSQDQRGKEPFVIELTDVTVASGACFELSDGSYWRAPLPTIKGNGPVKGYDEYALSNPSCRYQEPMQSFWLDTPEHGITIEAPIFVKADHEGWEQKKAA